MSIQQNMIRSIQSYLPYCTYWRRAPIECQVLQRRSAISPTYLKLLLSIWKKGRHSGSKKRDYPEFLTFIILLSLNFLLGNLFIYFSNIFLRFFIFVFPKPKIFNGKELRKYLGVNIVPKIQGSRVHILCRPH